MKESMEFIYKAALERIVAKGKQYGESMGWCPDCEDDLDENGEFQHRDYCFIQIAKDALSKK